MVTEVVRIKSGIAYAPVEFLGLSSDPKPANGRVSIGSTFQETDGTKNKWMYDGSTWFILPTTSGGGGGGTVTTADGADIAQGAKGDAAATDSTSQWSVISLLKGLWTKLSGTLYVNMAQLNGSAISNTNPLPISDASGSITIDQASRANLNANANIQIAGADVSSSNQVPIKSADGDIATLGLKSDASNNDPTTSGSLISFTKGLLSGIGKITDTKAANGSATGGVIAFLKGILDACIAATPAGANIIGKVGIDQTTAGSTNAVVNNGAANTNGCTNYRRLSTADTNLAVIKASAGRIFSLAITNTSAAIKYVRLYNKASAPVPASDNALIVFTFAVPAGQTMVPINNNIGAYFSSGIAIDITAAVTDTDTTAVAANDVILNGIYA